MKRVHLFNTATLMVFCLAFMSSAATVEAEEPESEPYIESPIIIELETEPETFPELEEIEIEETEPETEVQAPVLIDLGTFKLTAYCNCTKCCGKGAKGITRSGTKTTQGRTISVDPKVIPLGSTVYIDGVPYVAEDTGSGIKGKRIDMYFESHKAALEFGVQKKNVQILQ